MRKKEMEALRQLEEALLAQEEPERIADADETQFLDQTWQEVSDLEYDVYNTDDSDVDLDEYSDRVYRDSGSSPLGTVLMILFMVLLSGSILLLLKMLGVL